MFYAKRAAAETETDVFGRFNRNQNWPKLRPIVTPIGP